MTRKSTKERIRARRQRESRRRAITGAAIVAGVVVVIVQLASIARERVPADPTEVAADGQIGQLGPTMESTRHVPEGTDPGPYNTDPPTSGKHYSTQLFAGFFEEDALETYSPYPEGYLVHSLEHGYVIFWYNCAALVDGDCDELKDDIQGVMSRVDNFKVIGFPRPTLQVPVTLTTWERTLRLEEFDAILAEQFVRNYRNQAPERGAP